MKRRYTIHMAPAIGGPPPCLTGLYAEGIYCDVVAQLAHEPRPAMLKSEKTNPGAATAVTRIGANTDMLPMLEAWELTFSHQLRQPVWK